MLQSKAVKAKLSHQSMGFNPDAMKWPLRSKALTLKLSLISHDSMMSRFVPGHAFRGCIGECAVVGTWSFIARSSVGDAATANMTDIMVQTSD